MFMKLVRRLTVVIVAVAVCVSIDGCLFFSNTIPPDNTTGQTTPLPIVTTTTTNSSPATVKQQTSTIYSAPGSI
jgi:hypothetical protein